MNIHLIAGPLLGAVIGYFTNYIAVKMLFKPRKALYIGKWRLPFTPGLIPKEKDRLGHAIGEAVGTTLLTEDSIKAQLLSDSMKEKIKTETEQFVKQNEGNMKTLKTLSTSLVDEEQYESILKQTSDFVTDKIMDHLTTMDLGQKVADQVVKAAKEKVSGTLLAMMVNDELLSSFSGPIAEVVDKYVLENGETLVGPAVENECNNFMDNTVDDVLYTLQENKVSIPDTVVTIYDKVVSSKIGSVVDALDIATIVENKIKEMPVEDLETLVLNVMKKELNAIVNLGALIGFILGLLNLLW